MASGYACCNICEEDYDFDHRLPKSLVCGHFLCNFCLLGRGQPLRSCPVCRQTIDDPENVPNNLTMIDYMERKKQKRREKEQKALRDSLKDLLLALEESRGKSEQDLEESKRILAETLENKLEIFRSYAGDKFNESLMGHCENGDIVSHISSTATAQLCHRIQFLEEQTVVLRSLLDQAYIHQEEVTSCKESMQSALQTLGLRNMAEVTWNAYKEHLLDHFRERSREGPSSDRVCRTGK